MYPRNAASPERVSIGAVVQISDGAVQTSGVSIKVKPQGTTASAGGGTTSYEEGIVEYLPTQAETNYTSFEVIAYKTGCIPVSATVVTTASATPGYAGVDWSKVTAPTTTLNLSGTTIKTATDVEADTADIQSRIPAALVSGRIDASVGAMAANVMTAAAAASDLTTELQSGLATASNLAIVAGYLDTEIAAIKAKTDNLPAAPAATGDCITADGVRAAVGLASANLDTQLDALPTNAELTTALGTSDDATLAAIAALSIPTVGDIADAVHDEAVEGTTTLRQSIRLANAALGGKASGLDTTAPKYRDLADTKDRISATVDANGNRSAVTRDLS